MGFYDVPGEASGINPTLDDQTGPLTHYWIGLSSSTDDDQIRFQARDYPEAGATDFLIGDDPGEEDGRRIMVESDRVTSISQLERIQRVREAAREREESDLLRALHEARRELDKTRGDMGEQFGPDFAAVFHTHIQILEDKGFVAKLRESP